MSFSKFHLRDLNSQMEEAYHNPLFWLLSCVSKHEVLCLSACPHPENMAHCICSTHRRRICSRASSLTVKWTGCLLEVTDVARGKFLSKVIGGQGDARCTWDWSRGNWAVFKVPPSSFRPLMSQRFTKVLLPRVHVTVSVRGTPSCAWSASTLLFPFDRLCGFCLQARAQRCSVCRVILQVFAPSSC